MDDLTVAAEASKHGWKAEAVDSLPKGATLIKVAESPDLRELIEPDKPHIEKIDKATFQLTAPPGWSSPFCYGFDLRKPFLVNDSSIIRRLQERAKDQDLPPFKVERVSRSKESIKAMPESAPPKTRGRPKGKRSTKTTEGSDTPKGTPLTTYSGKG